MFLHQMRVNICCNRYNTVMFIQLTHKWKVSSCFSSLPLQGGGGLVPRCSCAVRAGGCGEVEVCTFVVSQHRGLSAGCAVTTSSPLCRSLLLCRSCSSALSPSTNNSFDLLLFSGGDVDFLSLCG